MDYAKIPAKLFSNARKEKNLTQIQVAQKLAAQGYKANEAFIVNIENDRLKKVDTRVIRALEKIVGKPVGYLTQEFLQKESQALSESLAVYAADKFTGVPVVGTITSEPFRFSFDSLPKEYLPISYRTPADKKTVALRIKGKNVSAGNDGEYILIVQASEPDDERKTVVKVSGQECAFKSEVTDKDPVVGVVAGRWLPL